MGTQLASIFEKAKEAGGIGAQVKLAMITKMSSKQAEVAPDSPDNVKLFSEALAQIARGA